jgi:hypothetical protein
MESYQLRSSVILANARIQNALEILDPGLRRDDDRSDLKLFTRSSNFNYQTNLKFQIAMIETMLIFSGELFLPPDLRPVVIGIWVIGFCLGFGVCYLEFG